MISLPCNYTQTSRPQKGRISRFRIQLKEFPSNPHCPRKCIFFCRFVYFSLFMISQYSLSLCIFRPRPACLTFYLPCPSIGKWTPNDNRKSDREANGETNVVKASRQYCFCAMILKCFEIKTEKKRGEGHHSRANRADRYAVPRIFLLAHKIHLLLSLFSRAERRSGLRAPSLLMSYNGLAGNASFSLRRRRHHF